MYGPNLKLRKAEAIVFLANTVFSVYNEDTICQITKDKHFWIGSWYRQNVIFSLRCSLPKVRFT